jgi:hypothetical protein
VAKIVASRNIFGTDCSPVCYWHVGRHPAKPPNTNFNPESSANCRRLTKIISPKGSWNVSMQPKLREMFMTLTTMPTLLK